MGGLWELGVGYGWKGVSSVDMLCGDVAMGLLLWVLCCGTGREKLDRREVGSKSELVELKFSGGGARLDRRELSSSVNVWEPPLPWAAKEVRRDVGVGKVGSRKCNGRSGGGVRRLLM
jgi:hypothetical protein